MLRYVSLFLPLFLAAGMLGCAQLHPHKVPLARVEGIQGHFGPGRIVDMQEGKRIGFEAMIKILSSKDLVFVGEVHDNPEHHLLEVQILQALLEDHRPWTVGLEFFSRPRQQALDRYFGGVTEESEFLEEALWRKEWGYPYRLYRALFLAARKAQCPVIALNAPRDVVKRVAREGLQNLTGEERALVAQSIDLSDARHRRYMMAVYRRHPQDPIEDRERFYEAQCVWEETMAESIAAHLKEQGGKMVVFAGSGHIAYKFGIPARALRRHPVSMATVLLRPVEDKRQIDRDIADFVWFTDSCRTSTFITHLAQGDG